MSFLIRKWLIIWKMDHPDVNLSFVYEVDPEKIIKCGICDCPADEKEIIICLCSHEYCSDCMLSYLECSKDSSKYYPLSLKMPSKPLWSWHFQGLQRSSIKNWIQTTKAYSNLIQNPEIKKHYLMQKTILRRLLHTFIKKSFWPL